MSSARPVMNGRKLCRRSEEVSDARRGSQPEEPRHLDHERPVRQRGKAERQRVRCSLSTTKSSLPGRYSDRSRTFADTTWPVELYYSSALVNFAGDVYVMRDPSRWLLNGPSASVTRLSMHVGWAENLGVNFKRPPVTPTAVLSPS